MRTAVTRIGSDMKDLFQRVCQSLGHALKVESDNFFLDVHKGFWEGEGFCMLRTLYYPAIGGVEDKI